LIRGILVLPTALNRDIEAAEEAWLEASGALENALPS
jgi:hypothetical protein